MKPTVGRVVHFYEDDQGPFAALVTGVYANGSCMLAVFKPAHTSIYAIACYEKGATGSEHCYWTWPPRAG